jgi:hypothetical protein
LSFPTSHLHIIGIFRPRKKLDSIKEIDQAVSNFKMSSVKTGFAGIFITGLKSFQNHYQKKYAAAK